MNYKQRFNKLAEKLGEHKDGPGENVEGIDRVFYGSGGFLSITANKIEIVRGCYDDSLHNIQIEGDIGWDILENLSEKIEEWFSYVESKVDDYVSSINVPKEIKVDGRKYKLVE